MGLCIGLTTALFGVLDALALRPVLVAEADRIVHIGGIARLPDGGEMQAWASGQTIEALANYRFGTTSLDEGGKRRPVRAAVVSSRFFDVFDTSAVLGRRFGLRDDDPAQAPAAVISYGLWQSWFGGDQAVLDGRHHRVVGVLAPEFDFPRQAEIWALQKETEVARIAGFDSGGRRVPAWNLRWCGKRRAEASLADVQAEMDVILRRLNREVSAKHNVSVGEIVQVRPFVTMLASPVRSAVILLFAGAALVLAMGVLNTSGILLTRGIRRRKESAVQLALGAWRGNLVRGTAVEAMMLGVLSAGVGLMALVYASSYIPGVFSTEGVTFDSSRILNSWTVGFCVTVSLAAGLIASVAPVFQLFGWDVLRALSEHGGGIGGSRGVATRRTLVVLEVALACALLVVAQMAIRNFLHLPRAETGFDARNAFVGDLVWAEGPEAVVSFPTRQREVLAELQALPGVAAAGFVSRVPLAGQGAQLPLLIDERRMMAQSYTIAGDYIQALGIEWIEGRNFASAERGAVIVNEALARRVWQGAVLGREVWIEGESGPRTVVGVVGAVAGERLNEEAAPQIYLPYASPYRDQLSGLGASLVVRGGRIESGLERVLRERILPAVGGVEVHRVWRVSEALEASRTPERVRASLLGLYSLFALLVAVSGIHVMASYIAAARTYEFGIRMVAGAELEEIAWLLLRESAVTVGAGIALGCASAAVFAGAIEKLVYGVRVFDPGAFAISALILGVAGCLDGLPAAFRASRMPVYAALQSG